MNQDRGEGGKFAPTVENNDVLRALREHAEPIATARDLATALDVTAETVRRRLAELHDAERVDRRTVGAAAVVWWPVDRTEPTADREAADPFDELMRATADIDLRAEDLDAMIHDSKRVWSSHS